jgi:sulfite reductase beta subunit-like hemoprotein
MEPDRITWKEKLGAKIPVDLGREIDIFEQQMQLRKQGKIDEKVFAETRLRRGIYGQRYDNGQRHDGKRVQKLKTPTDLIKGPDTLWDAPGMMRIKIPFGGITPEQLETIADLSEEYADGVAHVTTRQDFQLHYVHIEDTPALMRRLAAVSVTSREACGNSVRNVTACPLAGICHEESFDVTPYARACSKFLMGHPDTQDFGRKFKVAFSGCKENPCALVTMHDAGAIAKTKVVDGAVKRGFEFYVGGGLGSVPYKAKLFDAFLPQEELLPTLQAIARVYARLGEKRNRARARIKFLIAHLGIDKFRNLVLEEREKLPRDPRWTDFLESIDQQNEQPLKAGGVRRLVCHQCLQAAPGRLRRSDRFAAVGRCERRSAARARRHRAALCQRHAAHDGGAEHSLSLGERSGSAGVLPGNPGDRSGCRGRGNDC